MADTPKGPLTGVTVLDLSRVLAGPWATQLLADLGAEVLKVERPGGGDDTRAWGPPFAKTAEGERGDAAYFFAANRNKRSLTVDMAAPEGAEVLRRLAARADVVGENFKTGGLKKYGLDYASLSSANPKLVYCSITGFGQTGPYAARAGYDYMLQAMGGLMSITGQADGSPGAEPMKVGVAVADLFTGLYASNAILAALLHARAATTDAWMAALEAAGAPCGPINTVDRVFEEAQAKARGLVVEQARADLDAPVRTVASPMRLSKTPVSYRCA